ncbi:HeH/LEM domain-containing protein [Facklamia sp. P13069]|uniref:HeH/LEM domain-containing protein n=1 Tax=Facklamia sp. P13069 TaxID=3421954 RepID=UPI003D181312
MKALITTKKFLDTEKGPEYSEGDFWIGEDARADKILSYEVAKEATVTEIKQELTKREIEFDDKAKKAELIELLKGE